MFKRLLGAIKRLIPSTKAREEIERLRQDTETKERQCRTDALNGDTQAMRCVNALDETLSAQTMKLLRGQSPPAKHSSP